MTEKELFQTVYKTFGTITRARNCFLYTKKGIRLTDLYQENGRAILGWDAGDAFTHLKNTLNRGITGSFITEDHSRLNKVINQLFSSDRQIFFFSNKTDALKVASTISPDNTSIYKPWNPYDVDWPNTTSIVFAPPFPWTDSIYILAVKYDQEFSLPPSLASKEVQIPFPLQAGITRSIYNLFKALQEREEKDWFIYDPVLTKYWTRKGPYLFPKMPLEKYNDFVLHCLSCNLVINPDYNSPSIVPFEADKGVFTALKNKPFEF